MSATATSTGRRFVALLVVAITVAVGVPFFLVGFFSSYFMNGVPSGDDHLRYATTMAAGAAVSAAFIALALWQWAGSSRSRAAWCGVGGAFGLNAAFLTTHFLATASSLGSDPEHFYEVWTVQQVRLLALGCAAVAAVGLAVAVRTAPARDVA
jgi:hypothetical protein